MEKEPESSVIGSVSGQGLAKECQKRTTILDRLRKPKTRMSSKTRGINNGPGVEGGAGWFCWVCLAGNEASQTKKRKGRREVAKKIGQRQGAESKARAGFLFLFPHCHFPFWWSVVFEGRAEIRRS